MTAKVYIQHENVYLFIVGHSVLDSRENSSEIQMTLVCSAAFWKIHLLGENFSSRKLWFGFVLNVEGFTLSISCSMIPLTLLWKLSVGEESWDNVLPTVTDLGSSLYACTCNQIFIFYWMKILILFMSQLFFSIGLLVFRGLCM